MIDCLTRQMMKASASRYSARFSPVIARHYSSPERLFVNSGPTKPQPGRTSFHRVERQREAKAVVMLHGVEAGKQSHTCAELREHVCERNEEKLSIESKAGRYSPYGLPVEVRREGVSRMINEGRTREGGKEEIFLSHSGADTWVKRKRGVLWRPSQGEVGDVIHAQLVGEALTSQVEAQMQIEGFRICNTGAPFAGDLPHA